MKPEFKRTRSRYVWCEYRGHTDRVRCGRPATWLRVGRFLGFPHALCTQHKKEEVAYGDYNT